MILFTIQKVVNLTFADEGIDVITVGDGDMALREIAQARPDIVLADVHMPGPSGYEICSLMRGIDETANIPVMLLVGSFEQFDPAEADRVGANGYVTKPFQSIRQLVDQVKGLIASEPEVPQGDFDGLGNFWESPHRKW
jgi:CheY-like chemotaxis protein